MASTYPSAVAALTNPLGNQFQNSPSHSSIHANENTEIQQIQTFVGTLPASAVGTLMYDVRSPASGGGGHVQTAVLGGTGQTTYLVGDVLVGQSSSSLGRLAIGTVNNYALIVDNTQQLGVRWGLPGNTPSLLSVNVASVFTYVKPSVFSYLRVRMVGGGGGRGSGTYFGAGGGGGYSESIIPASAVAANVTIVVGATGAISSVGGTTAFGSVLTAAGGSPGSDDPGSGNITSGGAGGVGSGGQINLTGATGGTQGRGTLAMTAANAGIAPILSPSGSGAGGVNGTAATAGAIIIETY